LIEYPGTLLFSAVCHQFGTNAGRLVFCMLLTSAGLFISTTAFLPSSFALYMTMLSFGAWFS
jgi:alpha-1,2-mannosyltransferase